MVFVVEFLGRQKSDVEFQLLAGWCPNPCVVHEPTALALSLAEFARMAGPPELFSNEPL